MTEKNTIRLIRNPIKWIAFKVRNRLLRKHMNFTDEMLNLVYDTQYIYRELEKNKYFKTISTDDHSLRKLENKEQELNKQLSVRKNALIKIIMEYTDNYMLRDKNGELLTEEYLKQKNIVELTEFSEKLLNKVMNLEFSEE